MALRLLSDSPHSDGDEALVLEAEERGIERTLLDGELVAGDLLDAEENAVAVERAEGDRLQDEHVEGTLHEVELAGHVFLLDGLGETKRSSPRLSRRTASENNPQEN